MEMLRGLPGIQEQVQRTAITSYLLQTPHAAIAPPYLPRSSGDLSVHSALSLLESAVPVLDASSWLKGKQEKL